MFKTKRTILVFVMSGFLLLSCKDISKDEHSVAAKKTSKIENPNEAYATIQLEDGGVIELKPSRQTVNSNAPTRLTANMSDFNIIVMLRVNSFDKNLEEEAYKNPEADIAIKNITKNGPLDEEYRSYYYKNEEGEEGETKLTITYLGEKHSEGTFTGTLYSKSNKKATIEGRFNTKKKK